MPNANYHKLNNWYCHLFVILMCVFNLFLSSCSRRVISENELVSYLHNLENGVSQTKEVGDYVFTLTYHPTDLIVSKEIRSMSETNIDSIKKQQNKYDEYQYFVLDISTRDKDIVYRGSGGFVNFSHNLRTLSFEFDQYVYAVTNAKDTLPLADYQMPNLYGMSEKTHLLLAFKRVTNNSDELKVCMKDFGLTGKNLVFTFNMNDIHDVPHIAFND
jgi:hypothetical protein